MALPIWAALPATGLGEPLDRQDPWLAIADATGFVDHGGLSGQQSWPVSVQVDDPGYRPTDQPGLQIRQGHGDSACFTAQATRSAIAALAADPRVLRVQLAAPRVPRRPWPRWSATPAAPTTRSTAADGPRPAGVLLGVIDDGCPFAHPELLRPDGTLRVLRLWNQNEAPAAAAAPAGFGYGAEFSRADLDAMRMSARAGGQAVDSAACYTAAGMPRLRQAHSHGAHVLGLLAGARRWHGAVHVGVPVVSDVPVGTPARDADIAFVQLPDTLLQSVCEPALEHHAYDGLRYLCNLAVEQGYADLVIVLAYESWLGPHDGSSWFEQALDLLLDPLSAPAALKGLRVQLMLPAGNSRERAAHAFIQTPGNEARLHWHQPPGHEGPTHLELWAPRAAPGLEVRITPPGGPASPMLPWGSAASWGLGADSLACAVMHPSSPGGEDRPQLALRIAPTATWGPRAAAPHGTWTLELQGQPGSLEGLHARIGRVEPALRVPRRQQQAHFVQRTAAESQRDRLHTLNGHAGGQRVTVAGAFLDQRFPHADLPALDNRDRPRRYLLSAPRAGLRPARPPPGSSKVAEPHLLESGDPPGRALLHDRAAAYSGSGPSEGARLGPDVSVAVEDGLAWPGVLSLGSTSAAVTRLSGTSTAAPLAARKAADDTARPTTAPPQSGGPAGPDPAMGPLVLRI